MNIIWRSFLIIFLFLCLYAALHVFPRWPVQCFPDHPKTSPSKLQMQSKLQGAKSELKNLALVDVHQFRLTNFYFAWKLFRFQVPKTQPVIQKLDYCFQIDYIIIVHQCNETKSEIISTLCLCDGHPLLVGTPDNSSRVFNCFAPDKFLPFLRQCYVLRRFAPDNLYGFAGASRLIFFLRFFRRFAPDNFLRILLSVRCFAPAKALRAWRGAPRLRP